MKKPTSLTFDHDFYHSLIYKKWWYDETRNTNIPPKLTKGEHKSN